MANVGARLPLDRVYLPCIDQMAFSVFFLFNGKDQNEHIYTV